MSANVDEMRREAKLAFDAEYDEWPGALRRWADALEAAELGWSCCRECVEKAEARIAELESKFREIKVVSCYKDDCMCNSCQIIRSAVSD